MEETVFYLALFVSFFTVLNIIANITTNVLKAIVSQTYNTSFVSEMIQGAIACLLWTWFYSL